MSLYLSDGKASVEKRELQMILSIQPHLTNLNTGLPRNVPSKLRARGRTLLQPRPRKRNNVYIYIYIYIFNLQISA